MQNSAEFNLLVIGIIAISFSTATLLNFWFSLVIKLE